MQCRQLLKQRRFQKNAAFCTRDTWHTCVMLYVLEHVSDSSAASPISSRNFRLSVAKADSISYKGLACLSWHHRIASSSEDSKDYIYPPAPLGHASCINDSCRHDACMTQPSCRQSRPRKAHLPLLGSQESEQVAGLKKLEGFEKNPELSSRVYSL